MRTTVKILAALVLALTAGATTGTARAGTTDQVYVWNLHGHEEGRPDVRPGGLVLSESATLNGVTWRSWGGAEAVGHGELSGTWCLPECLKKPYGARVTLARVKRVGDLRYYTGYAVLPDGDGEVAAIKGDLPTP